MVSQTFICLFYRYVIHGNQILWGIFQFILLALFVAGVWFLESRKNGVFKSYNFFCLTILIFATLFLLRILNLLRHDSTDESQWIGQANNLIYDPVLWVKYFMPREFPRVFTIIPLALFSVFTYPSSWVEARILGLVMWTCFLVFFLAASIRLFNKRVALAATVLLTIIISLSSQQNLVTYNSEIPVDSLLMIAFYLFVIIFTDKSKRRFIPLMLGIVLVITPFAKEQSIYIVGFFEVFMGILLLRGKNWIQLAWMLAGNVLAATICLLPYFLFGLLDQLVLQIGITLKYSKIGLFETEEFTLYKKIVEYLKLLWNPDLRIITVGAFLIIIFGLFMLWKKRQAISPLQILVYLFVSAIYFITSYSVFVPRNFFVHYANLFYFPGAICFALGMYFVQVLVNTDKAFYKVTGSLILLFFILEKSSPDNAMSSVYYNCPKCVHNLMTDEIAGKAHPGDRLIVWGWNNSYYVETGLLPGSRYMYIQYLDPRLEKSDEVIKKYEEDMLKLRPKFFLELVGPHQFFSNDTSKYEFSNFPAIAGIIQTRYHLDSVIGEEKLYVRND